MDAGAPSDPSSVRFGETAWGAVCPSIGRLSVRAGGPGPLGAWSRWRREGGYLATFYSYLASSATSWDASIKGNIPSSTAGYPELQFTQDRQDMPESLPVFTGFQNNELPINI